MKMNHEDVKKSASDYAAAFNEDQPAKPEMSEDQAFGLGEGSPAEEASESPAAEKAEDGNPAAVIAVIDGSAKGGEQAGQTPMEAQGDSEAVMSGNDTTPRGNGEDGGVPASLAKPGTAAVKAGAPVDGEAADTGAAGAQKGTMTEQQLKSWEGRLKKAQAEIDAKGKPVVESPVEEALEDAGEMAEDKNPAMGDAIEQASEQIEDGKMTADQAMKQLAEDFGEDFVKMIETIATHIATNAGSSAAESKVGEVGGAVKDIINHINDTQAKAHFSAIAAKHPDFKDIGASQGFKDWAASHATPDEVKRIAAGGSSDEINSLLDEYKASMADANKAPEEMAADKKPAATDPVVNKQMDAAEGVRSAGMALPAQPKAAADGYEDAWKEFA